MFNQIRVWLSNLLRGFPWYYRLPLMVVCSALATMFPLPVPVADISYLVVLEYKQNVWWFISNLLIITITDTLFAYVTYIYSNSLIKLLRKNKKSIEKYNNIKAKLLKQSPFWLFIAGATPFPFTLTIYAIASLDYSKKNFTYIIFI